MRSEMIVGVGYSGHVLLIRHSFAFTGFSCVRILNPPEFRRDSSAKVKQVQRSRARVVDNTFLRARKRAIAGIATHREVDARLVWASKYQIDAY